MKSFCILSPFLSLALVSLAGCGPIGPDLDPDPELPEQASFCGISFEEDFPSTREVAVGPGPVSAFQPYGEGDAIDAIVGGQGAPMITPMVRVQREADDEAEPCFRVRLEEGPAELSSEWNVRFKQEGDQLFSDGALYFITSTTGEVELTLTVEGKGFSGTSKVNVVLK